MGIQFNASIPLLVCYDWCITVYLLLGKDAPNALEQGKED